MSRVVKLQTNFTVGEINPELRGRVDLQQYESALERARNVVINPRGTIDRRPGLPFKFKVPAAATPESGVALVGFAFSTTQTFILLFSGTRMYIFLAGVLQTNINGTGNDFLDVSTSVSGVTDGVTSAILDDMWWTQSADTLLLFHEDMQSLKIQRGVNNTTWTVVDIAWSNIPRNLFTSTDTNPAATLTPSVTDGKIDLTASAAVFHSGRDGTAQAGGASTITLDASAIATDDIYNGSSVIIQSGTGVGQERVISDYVGSTKVATVSVAWTTQPDSTSVFTVTSQVGQKIYDDVSGIGQARILEVESSTVVKAVTEAPFFDTDAIPASDWRIEHGYRDAWSSTRGWPRTATFHEGRLLVGGSKSLPTTVWGSKVGFFFDFDQGQSLDDEGLEATIDTDQVNAVTAVISGREFTTFTTGTEFTVPQLQGEPLTPTSFLFKPATRRGSATGIRPQISEGGTFYVQRGGKAIRELIFSDLEGSFTSNDISLLSSHLLQSPTRMVLRRGTNVDEGDLLLILNGGTGTLLGSIAAFSILRSQNVIAPALWTTEGTFVDVGIDEADTPVIYTVVKRTLPLQATCTITVSDAANIAVGSTITFSTNAGVSTTMTATAADPAGALEFSVGGSRTNDDVADNIAVGTGGVLGINGVSGFSAPNPGAGTPVITVTRDVGGGDNTSVTSSDDTRLTVTDFTGGTSTVYYLEAFDDNFTTDSSQQTVPAAYGTLVEVKGASQTGTTLIIDGLTVQPQPKDTFTIESVTGTYTIVTATTISGTTSTLVIEETLASTPADNADITFTSVSQLDNLSHLEAETIKIVTDDSEQADQAVASNSLTLSRPAFTYVEVGLEYPTFIDDLQDDVVKTTPLIRTMPVETRLPSGPVTGFKKRIIKVNAILDDSQNMIINGDVVPFRKFDVDTLDSGVAFFTGTKEVGPFLGYDLRGQVEITQDAPLFFTILALDYTVSVGQ
jgi:hypothetical protein